MIHTNEADFRCDIKWQDTTPWVTLFRHFVLGLKKKIATSRTFCIMSVMNYWTHTKWQYIHNVMMDILEVVGHFRWSIEKNDANLYILFCIFNFGHCELHFIYIKLFVVINFDALAQASDFLIERRQVVILCWMQDSNPEGLCNPIFSRLNACWQTDWAIYNYIWELH